MYLYIQKKFIFILSKIIYQLFFNIFYFLRMKSPIFDNKIIISNYEIFRAFFIRRKLFYIQSILIDSIKQNLIYKNLKHK